MDGNEKHAQIRAKKHTPSLAASHAGHSSRKSLHPHPHQVGPRTNIPLKPSSSVLSVSSQKSQKSELIQELRPAPSTIVVGNGTTAAAEEDEEGGGDEEWMHNFTCIRLFLILLGRWPITYSRNSTKGYNFRFHWTCIGSIFFLLTAMFTVYGLVVSSYNVVSVLMKEKIIASGEVSDRTKTQIIEQALLERHTIIVTIMLGSYGVNLLTSYMIFLKRNQIAIMFTRWTGFLRTSKLSCGGFLDTYSIAGVAFLNYLVVSCIFVMLTINRTSATTIGGPTVVSIMFTRHFLPDHYLENFVDSELHRKMHMLGLCIYFYVVLTCNSYMYMFLWLIKSIDNAYFCWNVRTIGVVEAGYDEKHPAKDDHTHDHSHDHDHDHDPSKKPKPTLQTMMKERTTYTLLYYDHIGLVRMLSWFNNMFAFSLEPYFLLLMIKIVYQFYLAALVIGSNGKHLNKLYLGQYFMRKKDYIPVLLLMYENCFMVGTMLYACSWLEDTSYDSYEVLRKRTLIKGPETDNEAFFYLSMFQSYTSTTKMAVYAAQYFCIDRYSVLHVLSVIMSNFLVVYQFRPLFDMDTTEFEGLRILVGNFLTSFEGLPEDHIIPVSDAHRNQESP